jgi:spermidine synthase
VFAVQSTSPLFARRAFWCIARTVESVGLCARPYHVFLPSFGEWGFVLAARQSFEVPARAPQGARFLDGPTLQSLFHLAPDMQPLEVETNRLDEQVLVRYYEDDWRKLN